MTAKDSADGVLGDLTAAGATAAWKIANVVLGGCRLTHAGADLQGFGNLGDGAKPLYASNFGPVFNGRLANAGVATTQSCDLPKENADQVKEGDRQTNHRTNKRVKVAKWTVSEAAVARATGKLKRVSKSDDVLNGRRRDVDERTRRDLDESDYE